MGRDTGVGAIWERQAIEMIMREFPGAAFEEGHMPMTPGEAFAELLTATRELVAFMRKTEPKRFERKGWKRIVGAIAAVEEAVGEHVDLDELLEDWAAPGRITDPVTSSAAASVASIGSGSARFKVGAVYYEHPEGLTADEAVIAARLGDLRNPWRRVYDLKKMGVLVATGEQRRTTAGAMAEVLSMTEMARKEWAERFEAV
jgi:hypothetical protein